MGTTVVCGQPRADRLLAVEEKGIMGAVRNFVRVSFAAAILATVSIASAEARLHTSGAYGSSGSHHQRVASAYLRHSSRCHRRGRRHAVAYVQPQIGALVITEDGQTVLDNLSDVEFNPASVAKLVTAYGAIRTFGLEHRFSTKVLTDGKLDESSGILNGNIYVEGIDPDFDRMDAQSLCQDILDAGVKRVNGKLIVSNTFSYGSATDPLWSARSLSRVWTSSRRYSPHIAIRNGASVGEIPESAQPICEYKSEPLRQTLKEMLSFSQNNVAEQLGRCAGGIQKLEEIVSKEAGLDPGSLKLSTASGLGRNRVTPRDMMLVLKSLRSELKRNGLDLQDICPVAGVDRGTLDERFTEPTERGSVVAKTGTLPGTDGGASALAGMFRSQKDDVYFVIFCWRGSVTAFRQKQDELIRRLQAARGGPKPFDYWLL